MDTYFAPAERADEKELVAEIETVNKNPVMSGLLHSISGLLAILDEHRQIVALNDSFLKSLALKIRRKPWGCGQGKYYSVFMPMTNLPAAAPPSFVLPVGPQ